MAVDLNTFIYEQLLPATNEVIGNVMAGDVTTIALLGIGLIVLFILIVLLVEVAAWLFGLVKRFFMFLIVAGSTVLFFFSFQDKIFAPNPDLSLVAAGVAGLVFALIALSISIMALKNEWQKPKEQKIAEMKADMRDIVVKKFESELEGKAVKAAMPAITPTQIRSPGMFSTQALIPERLLASFHDRSILAVLSYMVVAEFGVISGVTISAPNANVGIMFFAIFLVAALVFIKSTYNNYFTGIKHLIVALVVGGGLSIVLSHVWLDVPLEQLLSLAYFESNALVALVTGLAVSLFMGSKG